MANCKVPNCEEITFCKGFCRKHYSQMYKFGEIKTRTIRTPNDFIIEGEICKIGCYNRNCEFVGYGIIDIWNIDKCKPYKWYFHSGYLKSDSKGGVFLHHLILGIQVSKDIIPDHINRNRADCREENLRLGNYSSNNVNVKTYSKSGYRGVIVSENGKRWIAQITKDGINIRIGSFDTPELAAIAYNKEASKLHGSFAKLNLLKRPRRSISETIGT